jgi:thiopeptide-type bacteriocin biosynthesis protein
MRRRLRPGDSLERRASTRPALKTSSPDWVQVNCALMTPLADAYPPVPWVYLLEALRRWRDDELFELCFFVRKPPGLRLRFRGRYLESRLMPLLAEWLVQAELSNSIRGFRFSVYEPETFRFGGQSGMAVAHEYFDRNAEAVLYYEALLANNAEVDDRQLVSLALSNDLFGRCVDDFAELSDVWHRLRVQPSLHENGSPLDPALVRAALEFAPVFVQRVSPAVAVLMTNARADNNQIASKLRATAEAGRLTIGMRAWLMHACVFHWNQWGLTASLLRPMVESMLELLDPEESI